MVFFLAVVFLVAGVFLEGVLAPATLAFALRDDFFLAAVFLSRTFFLTAVSIELCADLNVSDIFFLSLDCVAVIKSLILCFMVFLVCTFCNRLFSA